ncbi:hypothetical protein F3F96_04365 [Mariprofundus sp. NF]|uniref:hypothetical protein n=1 Tax=Mariprofundus sp. NF TaxID=2608716 RepID=UPI0015A44ED5|nr:hypothetical protein [Mariprofundus sp. NF]NWF38361.1 hypothetical protein [Mariprofundus sp. NF]
MTEQTTQLLTDEIEQTVEEEAPIQRVTIEVLKAKGGNRTPRKATLCIIQTGQSEKHGSVRLACTPNGKTWYVVAEHPGEGVIAPAPLRHEREAYNMFNSLCEAK